MHSLTRNCKDLAKTIVLDNAFLFSYPFLGSCAEMIHSISTQAVYRWTAHQKHFTQPTVVTTLMVIQFYLQPSPELPTLDERGK